MTPIIANDPKPQAWSAPGRYIHAGWGIGAGIAVQQVFRFDIPYQGYAIGAGAIFALGLGWEALNNRWPKGRHMKGNMVDALMFPAGTTLLALAKWVGVFSLALLVLTGVALSSPRRIVTYTYYQSDCDGQCLRWLPADKDSARIVVNRNDDGSVATDTTFYPED